VALELSLHTAPDVPLEAEVINPDRLASLDESEISALPVFHGNLQAKVGDFFRISGKGGGEIRLSGDLTAVKQIGAGMAAGRIVIEGNVGMHLGAGISGGEILVQGNAGDWVAPEMSGGRIVIKGNAGHMLGSAYRGARIGMRGGEIIVHGNVGNEAGNAIRNGLIAIGGNCGDFAGVNMLAGTIIVLGRLGIRCGAGMKRGSIISMHRAELLPTFSYAATYQPQFLTLYLLHLRELGLPIGDAQLNGQYQRWSGDALEMNRGEILLLQNAELGESHDDNSN
jgi:formylmethanofuran dehydrogenase subunit C